MCKKSDLVSHRKVSRDMTKSNKQVWNEFWFKCGRFNESSAEIESFFFAISFFPIRLVSRETTVCRSLYATCKRKNSGWRPIAKLRREFTEGKCGCWSPSTFYDVFFFRAKANWKWWKICRHYKANNKRRCQQRTHQLSYPKRDFYACWELINP